MDEPPLPLETIVVAHRDRLVRYAARLMGDLEKGRDVVQDALVRFCREPRERVAGRELEWLYTVCRNRAFDLLRREVRGRTAAAMEQIEQPGTEGLPVSAWEAAELRTRVLDLVRHLPANQQEVIRLKFQEGFSYREIARITGLSVGNVGFLVHTAVARLRRDAAALRKEAGL